MSKKLKDAYTLSSKEDTINLYKYWSKDYDKDFAVRNNYKSPQKVVKYFLKYSKQNDTPILDVGAGTGLIGEYLNNYAKLNIHAVDFSKEMLDQARKKGCYTKIINADLNHKLEIASNTYGAVLSSGTFTHGHLGSSVLNELLRIVKPGGLFVISIHQDIYVKSGFKKQFKVLDTKILNLINHRVKIYGKKKTQKTNDDKVIISTFRKNFSFAHQ
tara:strand:- start:299 stop:943 length:645 start_codon:yes stop_codon:yes gene_type:complete